MDLPMANSTPPMRLALEDHLHGCEGCAAAYGEILAQKELLSVTACAFARLRLFRGRVMAAIAAEDDGRSPPEHSRRRFGKRHSNRRAGDSVLGRLGPRFRPWRLPQASFSA